MRAAELRAAELRGAAAAHQSMPMSEVCAAAESRTARWSGAMNVPLASYTWTSQSSVQNRMLRPSGDQHTWASRVFSSFPQSRLPSTEPTITIPSS